MLLIGWSLLSLAAFTAATWASVLLQACIGRALGIDVERVVLGQFPIARWQGRHWEWVIGAFPIGGHTQFRSEDFDAIAEFSLRPTENGILEGVRVYDGERVEQEHRRQLDHPSPGAFLAAPLWGRIVVSASGTLLFLLLGLMLLGAAVAQKTPQLEHCPPAETLIAPCSVGGLRMGAAASTWQGQFALVHGVASGAGWRLLLFQNLEGWGGLCAMLVTAGAAGQGSLANWLTCLGVVLCVLVVFNLLPLAGHPGGQILHTLLGDLVGQSGYEKMGSRYDLASFGFLLAVSIRILAADVLWLWSLWTALPKV